MSFKIESGIPVPSQRPNGITAAVRSLSVGDSFECAAGQRNAAIQASTRLGIKVVSRKLGNGRCRVWRVAEAA